MLKGKKMKCKCKSDVYEDLATTKELLRQANHELAKFKNSVPMPKELTAENGAKYIFMGEFKETIPMKCPECYDLDDDEECEECDQTMDVTIGWDTIKSIYALAVKKLASTNN